MPREILDGLLASDDGELERVARRWAATDELVLGRSTPESALVLLLALKGLAEGARVCGAELWYRWSLRSGEPSDPSRGPDPKAISVRRLQGLPEVLARARSEARGATESDARRRPVRRHDGRAPPEGRGRRRRRERIQEQRRASDRSCRSAAVREGIHRLAARRLDQDPSQRMGRGPTSGGGKDWQTPEMVTPVNGSVVPPPVCPIGTVNVPFWVTRTSPPPPIVICSPSRHCAARRIRPFASCTQTWVSRRARAAPRHTRPQRERAGR